MSAAKRLYHKNLRDNFVFKNGNALYYIDEGFKYEKTVLFDNREIYRVYTTINENYYEISEEIILTSMLKRNFLKGAIYELNAIYKETKFENYIKKLNKFINGHTFVHKEIPSL